MKLSEVIKAIEDGSKSTFVSKFYFEAKKGHYEVVSFSYSGKPIDEAPINGWEEVKPPRQWSEKELMLFKLLPDWVKWIATDRNGQIYIFEDKPKLNLNYYEKVSGKLREIDLEILNFLTITFEESPIYIGDLKGE